MRAVGQQPSVGTGYGNDRSKRFADLGQIRYYVGSLPTEELHMASPLQSRLRFTLADFLQISFSNSGTGYMCLIKHYI